MFLHALIHELHDKSEALLSDLLGGPEQRRTPPPIFHQLPTPGFDIRISKTGKAHFSTTNIGILVFTILRPGWPVWWPMV